MIDENALNIYTDGSSYSSPRKGGTGIIFVTINENGEENTEEIRSGGCYIGGKIGQMELQACIIALKESLERNLEIFSKIIIYTDSRYVSENYSLALFNRSKNKWKKSSGAPIANAEQRKELLKIINKIYIKKKKIVKFEWVKGHSKNPYNKAVDKLAKKSAKTQSHKKISINNVRRKKFKDSKTIIGSVEMQGQRISIYIVEDEYLKLQKIYKYRYQVISKKSPFYKKTDFIYSTFLLSGGHTYYVKFNENNKNPQIIKVFHEIEKK